VRAAVPSAIELLVEPGRLFVDGAGFACGRVVAVRSAGDRDLAVLELSRICHLRWSSIDLISRAPHPGRGRKTLVVGPTCFEEDALASGPASRSQPARAWCSAASPATRSRGTPASVGSRPPRS